MGTCVNWHLSNSNNFVIPAALAQVCTLLSAYLCARYDILVTLKTRDQLAASQYNSTALVMTCVNTANGYLVNGH